MPIEPLCKKKASRPLDGQELLVFGDETDTIGGFVIRQAKQLFQAF
jgi:hypothetical protein